MEYLKVRWIHENPEDPIVLMSELDNNRYEVRKVEIYLDGRVGYADKIHFKDGTMLGEEPIPEEMEILSDPQFVIDELNASEFERVWQKATMDACKT